MTRLLEDVRRSQLDTESRQTTRFDDLSRHLEALFRRLHDHKSGDVEGLESMLSGLRLSEEDIGQAAQEQEVLRSLDFPEKISRHENIPEAHERTFEWVFKSRDQSPVASEQGATQAQPPRGGNFLHWLQSGKGVFWVTGKPGSGKSTLIKFIACHPKTRAALDLWAGGKETVLASHYFWAPGSEKQKSLRGLLQKMIFDVLCRCPQLAWDMFPMRCQQANKASAARSFSLPLGDAWSLKELREALLILAKYPAAPAKFCFFIDGLDEYSGDHIDLCQMLKGFAESENLKCCVSSRLWNVFSDAFGKQESTLLRVHDLTQDDINIFARDRLTDIPGPKHPSVNEASVSKLADLITKRAEGVFLWVFLVTKEARDSIVNSSTMPELLKHLESVPNELEKYFRYILERIPERHHQYMAKTFQIALAAKIPHTIDVYHHITFKDSNTDYALTMPINDGSGFTFPDLDGCGSCKRQINDRCAGLFSFQSGVEFIHRTVYSYLMTGPMQEYLKSKIKTDFHPNLATLESLVFRFRCYVAEDVSDYLSVLHPGHCPPRMGRFTIPQKKWTDCFEYISEAMREDQEATFRLLDGIVNFQFKVIPRWTLKLKRAFMETSLTLHLKPADAQTCIASTESDVARIANRRPKSIKLPLKATLLRLQAFPYAMARLRDDPNYFAADNISALGSLLLQKWTIIEAHSWEKATIQLLECKFNPNELLDHSHTGYSEYSIPFTPWSVVMNHLNNPSLDSSYYLKVSKNPVLIRFVDAFLKHGADKIHRVKVRKGDTPHLPLFHYLEFVFREYKYSFPDLGLVRDATTALLDTSLQDRKLLLEDVINLCVPANRSAIEVWRRSAPDISEATAIYDMIIIEMMTVSLGEEAITRWQSFFSLEFNSPPVQEMVKDYLGALSKKRPRQDLESDPGPSSKKPRIMMASGTGSEAPAPAVED